MGFQQEDIADSQLSGFTAELVDLSSGITSGVVDSENNLYILDSKKLYFGSEKDYFFSLNVPKTVLSLFDISGGNIFNMGRDGSLGIKASSGEIEMVSGNLTLRDTGLYIKF
tara:strand:- start:811 stop:1146 length:336 start_codon:yes stop_codon:yes gene_type:complete